MWWGAQSLDRRVDATGWIHCDQGCRAAVEEAEKSAGQQTPCSKKNPIKMDKATEKHSVYILDYMCTIQSASIL